MKEAVNLSQILARETSKRSGLRAASGGGGHYPAEEVVGRHVFTWVVSNWRAILMEERPWSDCSWLWMAGRLSVVFGGVSVGCCSLGCCDGPCAVVLFCS